MFGLNGIQHANEERAAEMRLAQFKKAQAFDRLQEYHAAAVAAYDAYRNVANSDAYGMADLIKARHREFADADMAFRDYGDKVFAEGYFDGE